MLIATWLADQAKRAPFKDQFQEMILSQPFEPSEPDRLSDFLPRIFVSLSFWCFKLQWVCQTGNKINNYKSM